MTELRDLAIDASVPRGATFGDAARVLAQTGASAVAVLEGENVVGLVTTDDVLRCLFPGYLDELEHTAFIPREAIAAKLQRGERVDVHMSRPVSVEVDAGSAHLAELFLHQPSGALALVDNGRYVGVIDEATFVSALVTAPEQL